MFRKQQKEQGEMPKELKAMIPFLDMLPKEMVEKQFKKIYASKTKCLNKPIIKAKEIMKLRSAQTKKIMYKEKPVYEWLTEMIGVEPTKETKEFVKWFQNEYYKISLKDLGIFK